MLRATREVFFLDDAGHCSASINIDRGRPLCTTCEASLRLIHSSRCDGSQCVSLPHTIEIVVQLVCLLQFPLLDTVNKKTECNGREAQNFAYRELQDFRRL